MTNNPYNKSASYIKSLCRTLDNMLDKCYNPNNILYKHYGGRGIKVYKKWQDNRLAFVLWCLKHGWRPWLEFDRKNNDYGYFPKNIRFVSHQTNLGNRMHGKGMKGFNGKRKKLPLNLTWVQNPSHPYGKYQVVVAREGVKRYVGKFDSIKEAVKARNKAIRELEKEVYGDKR